MNYNLLKILVFLHTRDPITPYNWLSAWNWSPQILVGLFLSLAIYLMGVRNLWRHAGAGHGVSLSQVILFIEGLLAIFLALISPIDPMSEIFFSIHMVQHMLLLVAAAPLLVAGASPAVLMWALPHSWRRSLGLWWNQRQILPGAWSFISQPLVAWLFSTIVIWTWHHPFLYQLAVENESIHILEHLTFLISGLLFWWGFKQLARDYKHSAKAVVYVFTMGMHTTMLGALFSLLTVVVYPAYNSTVSAWGVSPIVDQQLAGVIMWVSTAFAYIGTAFYMLLKWLSASEQNSLQAITGKGK